MNRQGMGCKYPDCPPSRNCDGKNGTPIHVKVGTTTGERGTQMPVYKMFPRCPTAMVEPWTWRVIENARQYLAGLLPKEFVPSAQFAEVILMVKSWQPTTP